MKTGSVDHSRIHLLDFLRGLAVIGMMCVHANYMLEEIFFVDIIPTSDRFWGLLGPIVAHIFIIVAGYSFYLSSRGKSTIEIMRSTVSRTISLTLLALTISGVTYTFIPEQRISWGIIHFFALSSVLILLFRGTPRYNLFMAAIFLIIGILIDGVRIDSSILTIVGIPSYEYFAADYYPMIPWFGYILLGQSIAYWIEHYEWTHFLRRADRYFPQSILFIGRHALLFYAVHVPLLYMIFTLLWKR